MFPLFTGDVFNILETKWFALRDCVFNNDLYKEVGVEILQFNEDGNEFVYNCNGDQIFLMI